MMYFNTVSIQAWNLAPYDTEDKLKRVSSVEIKVTNDLLAAFPEEKDKIKALYKEYSILDENGEVNHRDSIIWHGSRLIQELKLEYFIVFEKYLKNKEVENV